MLSLVQTTVSGAEMGWDRQTLLGLGALAFLLAIWLLYRIFRAKPPQVESAGDVTGTESTLITSVPPPPQPDLPKMLARLESEYPEFCAIVREVITQKRVQSLLVHPDLRRKLTHLEMLLQRADRPPTRGTLGIQVGAVSLPGDAKRDAKATMLTIIRLLQELEGVRQASGPLIDEQLDRFLERL